MSPRAVLLTLLLVAACNTVAGAAALPDPDDYAAQDVPPHLSVGLIATFSYHGTGVGAGGFFYWPVLPRGFFPEPARDAVLLGAGLHYCYWNWREEQSQRELMLFVPVLDLRYVVYVFETVGLVLDFRLGPAFAVTENYPADTRLFWLTAGGVLWDLADFLSLSLEFGWGSSRDSLRLGMVFWF